MGRRITYIRKKPTSLCFNAKNVKKTFKIKHCRCTEEDWQCDIGYKYNEINKTCTKTIQRPHKQKCTLYTIIPSGFIKTAGNTCKGGIQHPAQKHYCQTTLFDFLSLNQWITIGIATGVLVFALIVEGMNPGNKFKEELMLRVYQGKKKGKFGGEELQGNFS
eukprot:TRINITY_DN6856_c0_g1_i1.p3 TRINITY_DN6856_c0_g1~~TRINITY_DN6856_c0_g1_i1.p3  ORF type:complete len:162 (-),score=25.71 TRINITY_DN6856_c0_g1_i1:156-641(-)